MEAGGNQCTLLVPGLPQCECDQLPASLVCGVAYRKAFGTYVYVCMCTTHFFTVKSDDLFARLCDIPQIRALSAAQQRLQLKCC